MESLGDRFVIERELGHGGMGEVLLAHDKHLDRRVAVKVLPVSLSTIIGGERFAREIRLTARLVHPNIVPLFDSGVAHGRLYYVMPYVDGPTLRAHLRLRTRLPVDEAVRIVRDVAEALAYAHAQGIVHRDVKPENIFCYGGRALLADFGIAKSSSVIAGGDQVTEAGTIVGTVAYMSPEQSMGEESIDGRSDLYSLGCVLYEMISGVPPFTGGSIMAILARRLTAPAPDLAQSAPETPAALVALVASLLAVDASGRPSSAADLLESLRDTLREHSDVLVAPKRIATARQVTPPPIREDSMAAFESGRANWTRAIQGGPGSKEKIEMALAYFIKARQLDGNNVMAIAGQADCIHLHGYRGFRPIAAALEEARRLRLDALALNDQVGELHTSIGVTMLYWSDDFEGAGAEFKRGIEIDPGSPIGMRFYGTWLKIAGRAEEGVEYVRAAVLAAPNIAVFQNALGDILIATGRHDEAVQHLRIALRLNPKYDVALERLEIACHRGGRADEALGARRALLGQRGLTERLSLLDDHVAKLGWNAARELDVRRELASLLESAAREDPFADNGTSRQLADQIIACYAELSEWTLAMDWVERGYHARPGRLRRVLTDFLFDRRGLSVDPRYAPLLRNAGLEELLEERAIAVS